MHEPFIVREKILHEEINPPRVHVLQEINRIIKRARLAGIVWESHCLA